ncbi:right-handed parallel beta-helix repeat-containing protein [Bacillus tuaregi]|uniref:right-handed parallel beta-helix repeat-containing protein n=1 Tax=Bacillus tuaregi TaxID=1816695 RepID=UPI000A045A07|nr:NosD domain-containing protein [Bacillus tuaregi]
MTRWNLLFFGMLLLTFLSVPAVAASAEGLQEQIDATPSGGKLVLDDGVYEESLLLTKPITIEGTARTIISNCTDEAVITMNGNGVTLKNLQVESCNATGGAAAIFIKGADHTLDNIRINTVQFGIKLDEAFATSISSVVIKGQGNENGIDLWKSSDNLITNTTIDKVYDGIYLENSHGNQLIENKATHARYGYHLMFSNGNVLKGNHSSENTTGAMIMSTKDTVVEDNQLVSNNENVHAQGLLLYDTYNAVIRNNNISYNRVGLFLDTSNQNLLENNLVAQNFIGMQLREFHENEIRDNSMIGNVYDSQAVNSQDNHIYENYWDSSMKLDAEGNGVSMIPYTSDPYFLSITNSAPEFQLFFHAPGMLVLQKLLKSQEEALLRDDSPKMTATKALEPEAVSVGWLWLVSLTMLLVSLFYFLWGRKAL